MTVLNEPVMICMFYSFEYQLMSYVYMYYKINIYSMKIKGLCLYQDAYAY